MVASVRVADEGVARGEAETGCEASRIGRAGLQRLPPAGPRIDEDRDEAPLSVAEHQSSVVRHPGDGPIPGRERHAEQLGGAVGARPDYTVLGGGDNRGARIRLANEALRRGAVSLPDLHGEVST